MTAPGRSSRLTGWPHRCLLLVVAGLVLLAAPARFEGPALLDVSPGHAISLLDLAGIVPLVLGSRCLHAGLWSRRPRLEEWVRESPWRAVACFSGGALGLGLLLASAFSRFFWWWAVGALLLAATHVPVIVAASEPPPSTGPGTFAERPGSDGSRAD